MSSRGSNFPITSVDHTNSLRYQSVLVVTYGRSGSTLLQGLLNAIPGFCVRGENNNFCWGLYLAWRSLDKSREHFGKARAKEVESPWYGAHLLDPELFLQGAKNLLREQLHTGELQNVSCWGFKEIRYLDHLDSLHDYLNFLSRLMPNVAILFNTRSHADVADSAFWKGHDRKKLLATLKRADQLFLEYAEKHKNAFVVRYERTILGKRGLEPLLSFLGAHMSESQIASVLNTAHSYAHKMETITQSTRQRERLRAPTTANLNSSAPCIPDSSKCHQKSLGRVLLISVVKDEVSRLPYFLEYYRMLGIQDFLIVDNGSVDGTVDFLRRQPDVRLYHAPSHLYYASRSGRDWINKLGLQHAHGRWALAPDADELLAWPACELEGINGLIGRAERMGLNRVFTPMMDVYANRPCEELPPYEPGQPFSDLCQWTDRIQDAKAHWDAGRLFLYSGPRTRLAATKGQPPLMTKQKLYLVEEGGYHNLGAHFDNYSRPSPLVAPFLHYKFMADFRNRVEKAIEEGQHWVTVHSVAFYAIR